MAGLSNVLSDLAKVFFPGLSSEEQEGAPRKTKSLGWGCSEEPPSFGQGPAPAPAPVAVSVYPSFSPDEGGQRGLSSFRPSSVCQGRSFYEQGSVCRTASFADRADIQRDPTLFRPAPLPDVHIPFKDGSSRMLTTDKGFQGCQGHRTFGPSDES